MFWRQMAIHTKSPLHSPPLALVINGSAVGAADGARSVGGATHRGCAEDATREHNQSIIIHVASGAKE